MPRGLVVVEPTTIQCQPNDALTAALTIILVLVLVLPFKSHWVERNLEYFFFMMGIVAVAASYALGYASISDLAGVAWKAVLSPVSISGTPIGITQVVLLFGLLFYYYHQVVYKMLDAAIKKMGATAFIFTLIVLLGLTSSVISVIVTAVVFSEIAASLKMDRESKVELVVYASFAIGVGAALTPIGEPLSTIAISKLEEGFDYLLRILGPYVVTAILITAAFASYRIRKRGVELTGVEATYGESLGNVVMRAVKVYVFVAALELLGYSFSYLAYCYFSRVPSWGLYWVNTVSAVVDNATLTAAEINKALSVEQIRSALMGLLIAGGMLIPGNIPNIVAAGRLNIKSREWARIGVPYGAALMLAYFVILFVTG